MTTEEGQRNKLVACMQAVWAARYVRQDNTPCLIEEGLFLGSVGVALNKPSLKRLNVTHILTVAKSLSPAYPNDFVYKVIPVLDIEDTKLEDYFDECFDFINEARSSGGAVLVHCFAGRSRSVTIIVAYLMKKYRMSLSDALLLVRRKRPFASPNRGFMVQLEKFEKSLGDQTFYSKEATNSRVSYEFTSLIMELSELGVESDFVLNSSRLW